MDIGTIKQHAEKRLLEKANVVGVMTGYKVKDGQKTGEKSIVCMVEKKMTRDNLKKRDIIPPKIKDVRTDVIEVGKLRALQIDKKARHRPAPMGTSGGHYSISAGTNGELLKDNISGNICIGTNNHVGANSNDAEPGDPYLQPGPYDGGDFKNDRIGTLLRFVPIQFKGDTSPCGFARFWSEVFNLPAKLFKVRTRLKPVVALPVYNLVDAALIKVEREDVLNEIVGVGIPKGVKEAHLDMLVQKSGRTTCHTIDGVVSGIDATIGPVSYGPGKSAYFQNQIVVYKEGFSSGGDSGSLILDMDGYAVGKLFAGSEGNNTTIANPIQDYLNLLDAELILE